MCALNGKYPNQNASFPQACRKLATSLHKLVSLKLRLPMLNKLAQASVIKIKIVNASQVDHAS